MSLLRSSRRRERDTSAMSKVRWADQSVATKDSGDTSMGTFVHYRPGCDPDTRRLRKEAEREEKAIELADAQYRKQLVEALKERDEVVHELRQAVDSMYALRIVKDNEINKLTGALNERTAEAEALRADKARLLEEHEKAVETIKTYELQNVKLEASVEAMCKEVEELRKKFIASEASLQMETEEVKGLREKAAEEKTQREGLEEKMRKAEEEMAGLKQENERLTGEVKAAKAQLEQVKCFQDLLATERDRVYALRNPTRKGDELPKKEPLGKNEVEAVKQLARDSAAVKLALDRTPAPSHVKVRRGDRTDIPPEDKWRWSAKNLNTSSSILARFYLPQQP